MKKPQTLNQVVWEDGWYCGHRDTAQFAEAVYRRFHGEDRLADFKRQLRAMEEARRALRPTPSA